MSNNTQPLIAIVDDDQAMRDSLTDYFHRAQYQTVAYSGGKQLLESLDQESIGVIICDLKMPQMDGMAVLEALQVIKDAPPLIMITAHGNIPTAVEAVKNGAYNFIPKPFNPAELQQMVDQAFSKYQQANIDQSSAQPLGNSQSIQAFYEQLALLGQTTDNLLLTGEVGVGKVALAKMAHQYSARKDQAFIAINCATLSQRFFEKTFVEEAALTQAKSGSIFLQGLDLMPLESRVALLELFEQKFGSNPAARSEMPRFICSVTQAPGEEKSHTNIGKICTLLKGQVLNVPALREHKDDVFELFNQYMAQAAAHYQSSIPELSEQDVLALSGFDWPGNQTQLKQVAEQFVLLNRSTRTSIAQLLEVSPDQAVDLSNQSGKDLRTLMQDFERQLLTQAMIECSGNISQVCELLRIPRRTLNEKLLKYDMSRTAFLPQ